MNKKIIKDTVSLVLITLIAALLLSFVFELTKDTIEEATAKERFESYEAVFESAKSFKDMDIGSDPIPDNLLPKGVTVEELMAVYEEDPNTPAGCVVSVRTSNGYGGDIVLSLGITLDGTITGMKVTQMSETSGLGAKCLDEEFRSQFKGIKADSIRFVKDGKKAPDEIDAISSATVTTTAITDAVNGGLIASRYYFATNPEVNKDE